jgi:O-antigen/teichoic acid export membrane protein
MAAAGAAGLAWAAIPSQTLIALGALRRLTVVSLATATVSTVLVVVATWLFALDGQFVAIAVAGLAAVPITYALASTPLRGLRWRVSGRLDSAYGRRALRIGVASLVAALTAQGMLFTIRWSLEARGGPALNGQFQAAWAIGAAYFGLVLSSLGNYAFPRYAAASSSAELAQELDDTLQFLFRITPPIIILAVGFRREIVEALYSHKFDPAVELMGIQMTGDFAKAVSWAHAGPLLYRGRIRAFLCTEVFASGTMIATVIPLVHRYGLDGVGYAYVITYASYVVVTAVALRIDCSVPFRLRYLLGTAAVTAALILMVPLERRVPSSRWLFAVGAIIWLQRAGVLAHLREGIRARARRVRSDPS